ncbi:unnamed protein product, partial [Discosporangium mesarthrocarpum]
IWEKVFGTQRPPLTGWDLAWLYGRKRVCFQDLAIGIFGPASPTTMARKQTPCVHTALVRGYADYIIRGLGLQGYTRYAKAPTKKVVVTWMARRSSVEWPEKRYCSRDSEADRTFFTCNYFKHLGIRNLQRTVQNERAVVQGLKQIEMVEFPNGARVEVRDMDYNLLSFEEQIKNDLETDIMASFSHVGPHGAGLFHIIFTPDRAVLIELQISGSEGRKHFNNLARWSGHRYIGGNQPPKVPVEKVVHLVKDAIHGMDLSRH